MTKIAPQYKLVLKDRLFYNRFEYAIGFYLQEVSCLRELDHGFIDTMIERRIAWREVAQNRWHKSNNLTTNILSRRRREITTDTRQELHEFAEVLLTSTVDFKLVVSAHHGHVYTNDRGLIDQLSQLSGVAHQHYLRAVVTRPKDTIKLRNPQHNCRSYFRSVKLTDDQRQHLKNFLRTQPNIRIGPALDAWLDGVFHRTQDYFFVDHTDYLWLTMLALVRPGLVRKTMQIIPANK